MSTLIYNWLSSGSNELTPLVEETILNHMTVDEIMTLKNMAAQVEKMVVDPILNHREEKTLQDTFNEKIPIFWSHLLAINYLLVKKYAEKADIGGIEALQQDEYRYVKATLKVIRSAKERIGAAETTTLLAAVRKLWEYNSLILSSYFRNPHTTEQAILSLDLNDLQQTVAKVCLPIILLLVVIHEHSASDIRLRNVRKLTLPLREYSKELVDYVETLDILVNPSSVRLEIAAYDDLAHQRFADLHELAKRR